MSAPAALDLATAVLCVYDCAHDFVNATGEAPDPGQAAVLANIQRLLAAARGVGFPVIYVAPGQGDPAIPPPQRPAHQAHYLVWGEPGCEPAAQVAALPGEPIIRKPRWGGFYGSYLADHLRSTGRDTLVLCGLSLAGGIETTVRDAFNHDLRSIVVEDACLTRAVPDQGWGAVSRDEVRKVVLSVLAQRFARITTTAELCAALQAR